MKRRTLDQRGMVDFPVHDKRFPSTGEGGTFVRLVVVPDDSWMLCCGGFTYVVYDECYLGDDNRPRPEIPALPEDAGAKEAKAWLHDSRKIDVDYEAYHFPHLHESSSGPEGQGDRVGHELPREEVFEGARAPRADGVERYLSAPYLAAVTLGSTGWSHSAWHCTYDDLTPEGKCLYDMLKKLYPGCTLHLQTWLDT